MHQFKFLQFAHFRIYVYMWIVASLTLTDFEGSPYGPCSLPHNRTSRVSQNDMTSLNKFAAGHKHHDMRACTRHGGKVPSILYIGTSWRLVISFAGY